MSLVSTFISPTTYIIAISTGLIQQRGSPLGRKETQLLLIISDNSLIYYQSFVFIEGLISHLRITSRQKFFFKFLSRQYKTHIRTRTPILVPSLGIKNKAINAQYLIFLSLEKGPK